MWPDLTEPVPVYLAMWLAATIVCSAMGIVVVRAQGDPLVRTLLLGVFLFAVILLGSKLLYLAEATFFPDDDYVPPQMRGAAHGFRIPGGIALLAVTMPAACRLARVPWPRFGDQFVFFVATALVFIRLGCFLNGCCFGKVSSVPWALSFPRESWVFFYHVVQQKIQMTAAQSLPVHPLQLYFLGAAVAMLAVLGLLVRKGYTPGELRLTFYGLFFGSTMLLEPLRANHLTLNGWLVAAGTLLALLALVRLPKASAMGEATTG